MTLDRSSTDSFLWQACPKTLRYASITPRAFEVLGYLPESLSSDPLAWERWVHADDRQRLRELISRVLADGTSRTCEHRAITAEGRVLDVQTTVHRMQGANGIVLAGVTEVARPPRGAEADLALLLECGRLLDAEAPDLPARFQQVADRLAADFTDWVFVDLAREKSFERVALAHRDSEKLSLASSISQAFPLDFDAPVGPAKVLRSGETDFRPHIPDWVHESLTSEQGQARLIADLKLRSRVSVPIRAGTRVVGVLTVATAESEKRHRRADIALLEDLGRRMGMAHERASLAPPPLPPAWERLSARQRQVLRLVAAGAPSAEIAAELGLSVRTVETHRTKILRRLGLRGPIDVANFAFRYRLLER